MHLFTHRSVGRRWNTRFLLIALFSVITACADGGDITDRSKRQVPIDQHEITEPGPLLTSDGRIREAGWARRELLTYNPEVIPQSERGRLREWDFYAIQSTQGSLSLTVTNIGFLTLCSADWIDFTTGEVATAALPQLSSAVNIELSSSAHGNTSCGRSGDPDPTLRFITADNERRLHFNFPETSLGPAMRGNFVISEQRDQEHLALVTPFYADPYAFFYEQKVSGTQVAGQLHLGSQLYGFTATESVAFMDWGRGVWPEQVLWRWGAAGGHLADGRHFGLNLGNGFGNTSIASANLLVIDGKAHKLGDIEWNYDRTTPDSPWKFQSADGNVDLTLTPARSMMGGINLIFNYSALTKTHGSLHGRIRLDDGSEYNLQTSTAFAEEMQIRW